MASTGVNIPRFGAIKAADPNPTGGNPGGPYLAGVNLSFIGGARRPDGTQYIPGNDKTPETGDYPSNLTNFPWFCWDDTWPNFYKPAVDFASAMGARLFRVFPPVGAYYSHANSVSYEFAMPLDDILTRYRQLVEYIASKGGYTYGVGAIQCTAVSLAESGDTWWGKRAPVVDLVARLAQISEQVGNCVGFDMLLEYELFDDPYPLGTYIFNEIGTSYRIQTFIGEMRTAIRAVAPNLPLTYSGANIGSIQQALLSVDPDGVVDFRDAHQYYSNSDFNSPNFYPAPGMWEFIANNRPTQGTTDDDLYYIIGETGKARVSGGDSAATVDTYRAEHYRRVVAQLELPKTSTGTERVAGFCSWGVFQDSIANSVLEYSLINRRTTDEIAACLAIEPVASNSAIWPMTEARGLAIRAGTIVPTPGSIDAYMYPESVGVLADAFARQTVPNYRGMGVPRHINRRARRGTPRLATHLAPWKDEVVLDA